MRVTDLIVTQGIHGFQAVKTAYLERADGGRDAHVSLIRSGFRCPACGQAEVAVYGEREREIAGLPVGRTRLVLHVTAHRIYCPDCGEAHYEQIPFLPSPTARVTRQMERTILELRREMSVSAVAEYFGLSWHTVKNLEKRALGRKYANVRLRDVRRLGIDEIYVFRHAKADEKYVTVVRDLDTGAVLEVARGKGEAALAGFSRRIRRYCRKIETVCMDMSNAYSAWVFKNLRNADVVYDHFHVIKAVNDRLDKVRRRVARDMDAATREAVKGNRRLFLRNVLSGGDPYSYAFAASEMERLHGFRADRSQVRLWAVRNGLARPDPKVRESCHWRRFQRTRIGELWQLDATPFAWFGPGLPQLPMLNMLDDCSRMQVGGTVYERETLAAYIHFLKAAFEGYGLPLQVYVDQAAFFKSPLEDGTTKLKNRLAFYGVSFIYANSPEAKGKVERLHQVWQGRLPPFFAKNGVPADLGAGNARIAGLVAWRNEREAHRETGMAAKAAWDKALAEGRSKLRPAPKCPWWDYVWSSMEYAAVLPRKRVRIGADEVPVNTAPGSRVILCTHTDGFHTVLKDWPRKDACPAVLFSDRPRKGNPPPTPTVRF